MKKALQFLFIPLILCLNVRFMYGQYSVNGRVLDMDNNPLTGATILVEASGLGTASDNNGRFTIDNIKDVAIVLLIDYLGFEQESISLNLDQDKSQNLRIRMKSSSLQLNEVTVSGIAEGQIKAMIEMKQADNIKNIVSAAQILQFPDLNAAEVMQRIPGITLQRDQGEGRFVQLRGTPPELTNFNINGEQIPSPEGKFRYVGMDIIPSDQIDAVEVTKVITPDMDADGIGGSVNIKTKLAQEGEPSFRATMAAGYSELRDAPNYNLQLSYGYRYKKVGFQINASYFQNNQGSDNIEYKFVKGPFFNTDSQQDGVNNFNVHYREVQLRHYDIQRTRLAISPTIDYKLNNKHYFYLQGMYNSFIDDEIRRRLIYDLDDPLNANYYLFGGVEHDVRDRVKRQELSTVAIGGEHDFGSFKLDYQMFAAFAGEKQPDRFEARFDSQGQAIAIDFDDSDPDFPRATFPNPNNASNATDYENFELDEMLFENRDVSETLLTPRFNIEIPYATNNSEGFVKFGAKLRTRKKESDVRTQAIGAFRETSNLYPGTADPFNLVVASDGFLEDDLLGEGYRLEFIPSADVILDYYEFWPQFFIFDRNESRKSSYNSDYTYEEDIFATYAMVRHNFSRLMILAGLRYEHTNIRRNDGFGVILNGSRFIGVDTIETQNTHSFLLPQLQLKYKLNQFTNLRAAISYTYARPNYEDLIPAREEDRREVSIGNAQLDFPRSTNVDLMIERYANNSIFSAGLFYKDIEDFVFSYKRFGREGAPGSGNFPVFEFTKPLNGQDARVFGAEFQAQFKFNFLPGFLRNFGLYTNYTYTDSEAFIPKRTSANLADAIILDPLADDLSDFFSADDREKISLPGQAQHTANVGLFYDKNRFFARLTANYQDDFLIEIGADPDLDEFYDEAFRLDFTTNYQLSEHFTLFADAFNLTNTPLRFYLGSEDIIKQQEFYSWWARIGIRWRVL